MVDKKKNFVIVHHDYLEVNFSGDSTFEQRFNQIDRLAKLVGKSKRLNLLVKNDVEGVLNSIEDIQKIAQKVHQEEWEVRNKGIFITVAILIPEQLLSSSSINQKKHKDNYTNIQFFSDKSQALEWLDIKTSLHNVVAYFQPVVLLDSRNVIGYEALARKVTKNKVSAPIDWLPQLLAEKGGSQRLTHHMLEYVLNILPKIPAEHYVSVNFEIEDLVDDSLNKILYRFKNESSLNRLVVEIAERGEVSMNTTHIAQKIKKLKMRIALDDFGAGSSRFLSLIDFKPEVIKLDKIVTDRLGEKSIQKFVKSLSEWGNENNTKLLAEGIEYEEQINDCLNAGVVLGQGYFFGKPSPWQ